MRAFPKPDGPYAVGTISLSLKDDDRSSHIMSDRPGRMLFLKLWYPAAETEGEPEHLWEHLRQAEGLPLFMRWLLWRFRKIRTSTYPNARFHPDAPARPLVVYSHGLISFAAENTSLAECLASHGYVVLAIDHHEQMAELQALNRSGRMEGDPTEEPSLKALKRATPAERAEMGRSYFARARNTNRIVAERAADIAHVLGRLNDVVPLIPGLQNPGLGEQSIFLVGLSLGGAVATEFAAIDQRAVAAVNMDGGMFGTRIGHLPRIPYLMLYSSLTEGLNDALLPGGAERQAPPQTAHLNYHDISVLMPELRFFGAVGKTDARRFIEARNRTVLAFLNRNRPSQQA